MMTQTLAIIHDAYRLLNAKKLFWISLIISGVVVAAFAMVGITEKGLSILWWQTEIPPNTAIISKAAFYKSVFVSLGVGFWITWLATILALVTTSGIIPDMLSEGAIDLTVSKPIGRVRLFLTKFVSGLLFVSLQVVIFTGASFLVIGFRGGVWEPGLFIAVPVVIIFFSYLFSICALFGVLTRSTVASLLLTLLVWFAIFGVHATESSMLLFRTLHEQRIATLEADIERREQELVQIREPETGPGIVRGIREALSSPSRERALERRRSELEEARRSHSTWRRVHQISLAVKTIAPKTSETIGLAERWLIDLAELPGMGEQDTGPVLIPLESEEEAADPDEVRLMTPALQERATARVTETVRGRSVFWIVGTSLMFEAAVLGLASFLFVRRDF